ncbi:MAG: hypothetical protein BMS9Abin11_1729 [Gammaproteobacteria bacterium]|nr:MAG: hypothetical protein BMS9Abin11_1729 [Gammaproteobacteria bacterium]
MKRGISDYEQNMLDSGVSFQVLGNSYKKQGHIELHNRILEEASMEDHRVWHLFCPNTKHDAAGVQARTLYELFHKECYENHILIRTVMMADLLKMGNKGRYAIDLDIDFITIPDFYTATYGSRYTGIEAPSVIRWMAYITGRYGVGFILYSDTQEQQVLEGFFNESFFKYYAKYLIVTVVEDK